MFEVIIFHTGECKLTAALLPNEIGVHRTQNMLVLSRFVIYALLIKDAEIVHVTQYNVTHNDHKSIFS